MKFGGILNFAPNDWPAGLSESGKTSDFGAGVLSFPIGPQQFHVRAGKNSPSSH